MILDYAIGAPVFVEEGEAGRLRFVVVDPSREVVTDLIVERGLLLKSSKVVPTGWVKHADENGIYLNAAREDIESLPDYHEFDFVGPDPSVSRTAGYDSEHVKLWALPLIPKPAPRLSLLAQHIRMGVNPGTAIVGRGTRVDAYDGEVAGTVNHVLVDPETNEVTHLVIHPGVSLFGSRDVIVSVDQVIGFGDESIQLALTKQELEQQPEFGPLATDGDIKSRLSRTLSTQPETRDHQVQMEVDRGLVKLMGRLPASVAEYATELARNVHGVVGVEDRSRRLY